jgi:lipopolysaccharide/colanic/teichoic acid biosynthesis glycosyltransferase
MVHNAPDIGPSITVKGDDRITSSGLWLRRFKLDELPQLFNVVKGDMGFVGPRPEDPQFVELYTEEQRRVLQARPGITSPASLQYRSENELLTGLDWKQKYLEEIMPHKLQIELDYLDRRTFWTDLGIIFSTIRAVYRR